MDRLAIELYSDRVERHAARLADELAAARLRLTWREIEHEARLRLPAGDCLVLEAVGVLAGDGPDDAMLVTCRSRQIEAVQRLQAVVEELLDRVRSISQPVGR